jgi:hypothetical protein
LERFLQYLDDFDDLFGMIGLIVERLRRFLLVICSYLALSAGALAGAWLASLHPPIALATFTLLFVMLLYRSVTSPSAFRAQIA